MEFTFYITFSAHLDRYYIGHTENIAVRLKQHNNQESKFTSKANDWVVVYCESFIDRESAHKREMAVKRKKSRKYIEWLITTKLSV